MIMYRKGSEIIFADHLSYNLDTKSNPNKVDRLTKLGKLTVANVDLNVSQINLQKLRTRQGWIQN